jgi:hypothetical protein
MKLVFTHKANSFDFWLGNYLSLTLWGRLNLSKSRAGVRRFPNVRQLSITHVRFVVDFPCRNRFKGHLELGVPPLDKVIGAD